MLTMPDGGHVCLTVPASNAMMLVIRLTTAGVTARAGLTIDAVDDFKFAVEEAANCLLMQSALPKELTLEYMVCDGSLEMTIAGQGPCADAPASDADEMQVIRCILESMVDEADIREEDGCVRGITLRKKLR